MSRSSMLRPVPGTAGYGMIAHGKHRAPPGALDCPPSRPNRSSEVCGSPSSATRACAPGRPAAETGELLEADSGGPPEPCRRQAAGAQAPSTQKALRPTRSNPISPTGCRLESVRRTDQPGHITLIRIRSVRRAPIGTLDHEEFSFREGFSLNKLPILRDQVNAV